MYLNETWRETWGEMWGEIFRYIFFLDLVVDCTSSSVGDSVIWDKDGWGDVSITGWSDCWMLLSSEDRNFLFLINVGFPVEGVGGRVDGPILREKAWAYMQITPALVTNFKRPKRRIAEFGWGTGGDFHRLDSVSKTQLYEKREWERDWQCNG